VSLASRARLEDSRLDLVSHLALYTSFHRAPGNKLAHAVFVPVILFSAMCLQAYVPLPLLLGPALSHVATLLTVSLVLLLATIDLAGALVLFAILLPMSFAAGLAATLAPASIVVPTAIALQLFGWYATVRIGHCELERPVEVATGAEDSNVYFRRRYHLAEGIGRTLGPIDALIQFCISPLSVVQDGLALLGLRHDLEKRVTRARVEVLARLARGEAPLA
jgi:uncharacterized membrane protein YGL010W